MGLFPPALWAFLWGFPPDPREAPPPFAPPWSPSGAERADPDDFAFLLETEES